jgi:hypothetical protein
MILDPWRQLATKMVREGLLGAHETEDCFTPKVPMDKSEIISGSHRPTGVQNIEMNSVNNIERI